MLGIGGKLCDMMKRLREDGNTEYLILNPQDVKLVEEIKSIFKDVKDENYAAGTNNTRIGFECEISMLSFSVSPNNSHDKVIEKIKDIIKLYKTKKDKDIKNYVVRLEKCLTL
jgi:hypothetical protein